MTTVSPRNISEKRVDFTKAYRQKYLGPLRFLKRKDVLLQISGISSDIFKQIETVENDHDASTAAALEAVERRGDMVVRVIEPRQMGRQVSEAAKKFIAMQVRPR